jgi:hypothetical protein
MEIDMTDPVREALPCPFCGHATAPKITSAAELSCEDEEEFGSWPHSDSFAVICDAARPGGAGGCGAMGGFMPTEAEAVQRWNERAALAQSAVLGEPLTSTVEDLQFVSSVLDDVLGDIADWEDGALADAVTEAKARITRVVLAAQEGKP